MGLFENIPAIIHDDVPAMFGTLSHLSLGNGTAVENPQ